MITFVSGNIFESGAPVIVNTVNCKGVMGVGLALACRERWPLMFQEYRRACARGQVRPGKLHVWTNLTGDLTVINFPTKDDWRQDSEYSYIESGLVALRAWLEAHPKTRIAVPALGCRNGRLKWERVRALIEQHLASLDADIIVYMPSRIPLTPNDSHTTQRGMASNSLTSAQTDFARKGEPSMFLPITDPSEVTNDLTNAIVVVSGHRPFPKLGGYGLDAVAHRRRVARAWLEALKPRGVIDGFAQGWDLDVVEECVLLGIPFLACIPCHQHENLWPAHVQRRYRELRALAAKVEVVTPAAYTPECMQTRNVYMADRAAAHPHGRALALTLWDGSRGGTYNFIAYARTKGIPMINAWRSFEMMRA